MSLDTYANLQTEIAGFLNRDDLTSAIPTFIDLAEAQMSRDIRHWRMQERATITIDAQYEDRPTDWIETIRFVLTGNGTSALDLLAQNAMADFRSGSADTAGTPRYYTHTQSQFEFYPTPDETYIGDLLYYQQIPALSDSNTTNWLLTNAPDVYLYGALLHTAPYLQEDARVTVWAQLYSAAVARLNAESDAAAVSGSGLRMKIRGLG